MYVHVSLISIILRRLHSLPLLSYTLLLQNKSNNKKHTWLWCTLIILSLPAVMMRFSESGCHMQQYTGPL